jgi:DNA repair protein RecN (Recombination protein N)
MLLRLDISNFAIIDNLHVDFAQGLNIITGETGAGKSILMNALGLILGERADTGVLRDSSKKCIVEALFTTDNHPDILSFLDELELDREEELIIRREISAQGKSRAFINDSPATLQQIRSLGRMLVDLHQQFDTQELGSASFQLNLLDAFSGNRPALIEFVRLFDGFREKEKELNARIEEKQRLDQSAEYHRFLLEELDELALRANELEDLATELKSLTHIEEIKRDLVIIHQGLEGSEQSVRFSMAPLIQRLQSVSRLHGPAVGLLDRMKGVQTELADIAREIERTADSLHHSPEKIEELNQRLDRGYRLLKKHQVNTTDELLERQEALRKETRKVEDWELLVGTLKLQTGELRKEAEALALSLSKNRKKSAGPFAEKVNERLLQVGMPVARFQVELKEAPLNRFGIDSLQFLFDANKSGRFATLEQVASGGELSRLMLCIKSLVAGKLKLPTLIFDEIDTGISGEAAKRVGAIMKKLGQTHQLIAVTHQPQIAAQADAHFHVQKTETNGRMETGIRLLDSDERVVTIARMLSGERPTQAALENARELLQP